jgi:hypothetical protein
MYPPHGIIEIDGQLYEWRYNDCICGLYEVEETGSPEKPSALADGVLT